MRYFKERVVCVFRGHDIPKHHLVHEMGALFRGGVCARCKRFWIGPFVCNAWDESQTEQKDGVVHLQGVNPRIGSEGWHIIGDVEQMQEISRFLLK